MKLEPIPAPDLAAMSIKELWCLQDLYQQLAAATGFFLNQPRFRGQAYRHGDDVWQGLCRTREDIVVEMQTRQPVNHFEVEARANVLLTHLATYGDFGDVIGTAREAEAQLEALKVAA